METNGIMTVMRYLPAQVQAALRQMPGEELEQIQEIRLRADRPVAISIGRWEQFLTEHGTRTDIPSRAISMSQQAVERVFQAVCEYSVYRYTKEICDGFVTVSGGNRVGIAGSAVYRDGVFSQIRHINGLNFRISHAVTGCAQTLYGQTCSTRPNSLLLAGAVGSGKTTMLRDMCRLLGASHRVTLVDERSEIAAMHHGVPRYDVGLHTDVLDGFPRAEGLLMALRVLTPEVLICDEIGTETDAEAILRIHGCGVPVIASAHAASWTDLEQRPVLRKLMEEGVFSYVAMLSTEQQGMVQSLRRVASC